MRRGFHSISHRLFVLFLFCMSAIVLIVSLLYYNRTTEQFHAKISDLAQKNVSQTVGLFDLLYKGYDSLSKTLSNNFDVVRLLNEKTKEPAMEYINEQSITNMIGAIFYSRDDLVGIHVITDQGKIYNYGNYMNVVDPDYAKSEWYSELQQSSGKMVWLGVFPHSLIDRNESRPVFAFGRQIFDLNEHKPIGIVLYETNPKPIVAALDNLKLGPNSHVYVVAKGGRVVSSTIDPVTVDTNEKLPHIDDQKNVMVEQDKQRLIVASKLPFTDWSVVSVTPDKDLNVELVQMKKFLLYVVSILIVVSALIASIVSRTLSSPLKRLIRGMKQVEMGNFRGQLNVTSYQEINSLVASFNRMVLQIEELIERVKISSVSEKNAEIYALQSQVNPHFLYNTLDMIYWMLDEKGDEQLGEIILSLSHMFRYSSRWVEGAEITLQEEFDQIVHYLTIIQFRLEGRLQVDMGISEEWMAIQVPKMTLQPVIENAVKHGLEALGRPGILKVDAQADGQDLRIRVADNGRGMSRIELDRLTASLEGKRSSGISSSKKVGGIGLLNLHQRLKHMFGEAYGLEIYSILGEGTTVTIVIPLPAGREEN
ncbi:two-component system sensor histidine kinase YesM [Paenibacillus shirakamiensis]|uniref:histidine kinase n=1 Tax=Paenibacillus shirakamiensis TaxID=1265935 RepID=A0ABS4JK95_9BACL|nr:sensor histidine kinase [Paenibacillus shirakamiensis]MBP2001520.1 two-component system sensor histidine kinase YesM [Paenibacillus shirakamiensis]